MRVCERLSKLDFGALLKEGSKTKIFQGTEFGSMPPNAVFGTIQVSLGPMNREKEKLKRKILLIEINGTVLIPRR